MKKGTSLTNHILYSFVAVILVLGLFIIALGYYSVNNFVIGRAQQQVRTDLKFANAILLGQLNEIKQALRATESLPNTTKVKAALNLDYIFVLSNNCWPISSQIGQTAFGGQEGGGFRLLSEKELAKIGRRISLPIVSTPKSRPTTMKVLTNGLALEYALPIKNSRGQTTKVILAGKLLNGNIDLVDHIRNLIFDGKPSGTVTIFQDDIRIATNVLNKDGQRAVGTRVSQKVYDKVIVGGQPWGNRAFVVTDWYLTAYEPIKDLKGKTIGMLYVGILERPFLDLRRNILLTLLIIIILGASLAIAITLALSRSITSPTTKMLDATRIISEGDLDHRISIETKIEELNELASSFNNMSTKLKEKNQSYLDLISFVTHELKGILASTLLNAATVRDGYLGMMNFKQTKALDAVIRNLDYFNATVKNFLSLSRLEGRETPVSAQECLLKEDIFDPALEEFKKLATEKGMEIVNNIPVGLRAIGERDLLMIAANNLIGNAVKYGQKGGRISLTVISNAENIDLEIFNEGSPIPQAEQEKLFKKFSRLLTPETKLAKGTGIGLYITKEIIERNQGSIKFTAKPNGNAFVISLRKGEKDA